MTNEADFEPAPDELRDDYINESTSFLQFEEIV